MEVSNTKYKGMVVIPFPDRDVVSSGNIRNHRAWRSTQALLAEAGLSHKDFVPVMMVNKPPAKRKASAVEIGADRWLLWDAIRKHDPEVIITLGSDVWNGIGQTSKVNFTNVKGQILDSSLTRTYTDDNHPDGPTSIVDSMDVTLLPIFNPEFIGVKPSERYAIVDALKLLKQYFERGAIPEFIPEYSTIESPYDVIKLKEFIQRIVDNGDNVNISLDCEWHGDAWYKDNITLRTIQLCINNTHTFVWPFTRSNGEEIRVLDTFTKEEVSGHLRDILLSPSVGIIGHNVKEDNQWLYATYGVDITDRVVFDTMLAESLINQNGPFDLEAMALKYTDIGRWSIPLSQWRKTAPPALKADGFGYIPDEILEPYAATDVIATYQIAEKQIPLLRELGYMDGRGKWPSLFTNTMDTQTVLVEIERTGLPVDMDLLDRMTTLFNDKLSEITDEIVEFADPLMIGYESKLSGKSVDQIKKERDNKGVRFLPTSSKQVSTLLFNILKLQPFKATKGSGGKLWRNAVADVSLDDTLSMEELSPATDTTSMIILSDSHPIVSKILDFKRIDQSVKTWLKEPELSPTGVVTGGLAGVIGKDNALHPSFRMGLETGRLATSKPNSQNFPKRAQGYVTKLFTKELETVPWLKELGKVPMIRNLIIPPDGCVIMEGDFVQAELFVLAGLSGDKSMMAALTTPGLDLHTKTACDSFGVSMFDSAEALVEEELLLRMAQEFKRKSPTNKEFEELLDNYMASLVFVPHDGARLTYKQFKDTLRIAGKAVNFGIPYGRGAESIAIQIKAETGTDKPLSQLTREADTMITSWKNVSYPNAWGYMESCKIAAQVEWEVKNPWGRSRRFVPTTDKSTLASYGRQGSNFPIQSTVADTCNLAVVEMARLRTERGLKLKICNLVHDSIITFVPEDEVQTAKELYEETMGNIPIPMPDGTTLTLGIDVEISSRWGESL